MNKFSDTGANSITNILVSQPEPVCKDSPYARLRVKYELNIDFRPFVEVKPISFAEFRKQKIDVHDYTAVIFTSRGVVDQFFRLLQVGNIEVSTTMKYFCVSDHIVNYLQKYIVVKKRKVFRSQGAAQALVEVISTHPQERFLMPRITKEPNVIVDFLERNAYTYREILISQTLPSDLSGVPVVNYDIITFSSPSGIKAFFKNFPKFEQREVKFACFGASSASLLRELGFTTDIEAPLPHVPSMVSALELYLKDFFG